MNELETALYAKLAADSTLTGLLGGTAIYNSLAPQDTDYPIVTFGKVSEIDSYALAGQTVASFVYQVKAITQSPGGSPTRKAAGAIDAQIKATLNDATLTVTGKTCLSIRRESGFAYDETQAGQIFSHVGGNYRIWTTP